MAEKELTLGTTGGRGNKLPPADVPFTQRELPSANTGMVWRFMHGRWELVPAAVVRGPILTKG